MADEVLEVSGLHRLPGAAAVPATSDPEPRDSAFDSIFRANYGRVVSLLARIVGSRAIAEELASDAFLKLLHKWPEVGDDFNAPAWLYRTATNLGIDTIRSRGRLQKYERLTPADGTDHDPGPLDQLLREERCRPVREVLRAMKPVQSRMLMLRMEGFSYREIAAIIEVQASSIGTLLARAEAEFNRRYSAAVVRGADKEKP